LDPPEPLHPAEHDLVPAPLLGPEPDSESVLRTGGFALWRGVSFPFRLVFGIVSLLVPNRFHHMIHKPTPRPALGTKPKEREPFKGEAAEELHDALAPMHDQLRAARFWWILEYTPQKLRRGKAVFDTANIGADYHWMFVPYFIHVFELEG
jgi:hypothetical protein